MVKSVNSTGALTKLHKDISSAPDSAEPSGCDSSSCAICWSEFGIIQNRKQLCQVTYRYVCDRCSTKRLVEDGNEYRISDGQFLLAKIESGKANTKARAKKEEESRNRRMRVAQARASNTRVTSRAVREEHSPQEKVESAASVLNQTRDAVVERGEKLHGLAEKSEALNKASMDFAQMAKELNQQNQSSFW